MAFHKTLDTSSPLSEGGNVDDEYQALDGVNEWFDDYMAQEEARISDGS